MCASSMCLEEALKEELGSANCVAGVFDATEACLWIDGVTGLRRLGLKEAAALGLTLHTDLAV